jgi:hypothetical protein
MPEINIVQSKVAEVKPNAINKVILKTALMAEKVAFLKPDNRPLEVIKFEREVVGNPALQLLGSRVFGHEIGNGVQRNNVYVPEFLSAIHFEAPAFLPRTREDYYGVPYGTTVLVVNSGDGRGTFRVRWNDQTVKFESLETYVTRPATESEISALLDGLFEARPMQTVALFTSSKFSDSVDMATPEA